ncbi:nucleotidyltransferase family protein [Sinomonas sp. JGH33]|uniref:Nucleotidyltransferase family protein n=1 Tax=Sinomonas terricola TaxID=3110330 RepID=A0ABU5T169_9MICC|nr:nucleotidyltransferase family protein [Sinomonas sp. JGH33]MEA5453394.1 nucleotidyltransferase family protein [Sinomonas sp. JGH33]
MDLPSADIGADENVALCHALVEHVCQEAGLRALFIKGPGAAYSGLRDRRTSHDTDVLVHPAEIERLTLLLASRGWIERPRDPADDVFPQHSRSLYHHGWMTDIDVHTYFPGFEAPAGDVFGLLWGRRTPMPIAGRLVSIPDKPAGALVLALHLLRSPWLPETKGLLDGLARRCADIDPGVLLHIAERGGGQAALRPFFEENLGLDLGEIDVPPPSREWMLRTTGQTSAAIRLIELVDAPWHRKPGMLRRALFPSRDALAAMNLHIVDESTSLWRPRWRRLCQSLREIRSTLRSYHKFRAQWRQAARRGGAL